MQKYKEVNCNEKMCPDIIIHQEELADSKNDYIYSQRVPPLLCLWNNYDLYLYTTYIEVKM